MLLPGNFEQDESRLRWQCRRGMLELDLMLQAFVDKCYDGLSLREKKAFHQLLNCQDQILLDYLLGQDVPNNKDVAYVAQQIRAAAGPDT